MKNIGITLGLWWLSTFDKSQFLFKSLKILPIYIRYLFYILLVTTLYFSITKLGAIIDVRSYTSIPVFIQSLLILIGLGIKILSILFSMGIFAYENLYSNNFNLDLYLQEQKQKKEFIKINKLEKWRLKNMHWFIRILLYATIWAFSYLIIEDILINAFFNVYGLNPSKEIYIKFLYDYDFTIKFFTAIYLIIVVILDYFVRKRKNRSLK
ncbi:MAG: hypothetical protein RBR65_00130 [Aliarcobacter sp.]|jgi:hypothetical protein|nr:hypothetical protein [Aliarcobacter sp.]